MSEEPCIGTILTELKKTTEILIHLGICQAGREKGNIEFGCGRIWKEELPREKKLEKLQELRNLAISAARISMKIYRTYSQKYEDIYNEMDNRNFNINVGDCGLERSHPLE